MPDLVPAPVRQPMTLADTRLATPEWTRWFAALWTIVGGQPVASLRQMQMDLAALTARVQALEAQPPPPPP